MPEPSTTLRFLTQQALADFLGCSVRQVQKLTHDGKLPVSYALGPKSPRYDRLAIEKLLAPETTADNPGGVRLAAG